MQAGHFRCEFMREDKTSNKIAWSSSSVSSSEEEDVHESKGKNDERGYSVQATTGNNRTFVLTCLDELPKYRD